MKTTATSAADLHSAGRRLDASYHASEGQRTLYRIRQWAQELPQVADRATYGTRRLEPLYGLCLPRGVFVPGRFKRVYVDDPEHGEPWLSPSDILKVDLSSLRLISRKFTPGLAGLRVRQSWILLSRSGTIGNLAYVRGDMDGLVGSDDIIRIMPDSGRIPPGYLYAFLSSPLGRTLIEQKTYGAVIPHIEAHHVVDLPIPRLEPAIEQRMHELIERAAVLRVEAHVLLEGARTRLLELNGLPELQNREALTKGCWCFSLSRGHYGAYALTAWTHGPITRNIVARIRSSSHVELGALVQSAGIFYGHQFKRLDADPSVGIELLSQAHVFEERPSGRWISKRSVADYREYMVPDGAILVAAQGTMGDNELFGRSQFNHRNFDRRMITQHIMRVIPDTHKVNPGYLFAFLSSRYGFHLLRSTECGTKLLGFILAIVEQMPVPMLSRELQDEIGSMVYRAYDDRADALALEDQAQALLAEALGMETLN